MSSYDVIRYIFGGEEHLNGLMEILYEKACKKNRNAPLETTAEVPNGWDKSRDLKELESGPKKGPAKILQELSWTGFKARMF